MLRIFPASRAFSLSWLDGSPQRLVEWNRKRLGTSRGSTLVLLLSTNMRRKKSTNHPISQIKIKTYARPLRSLISSSQASTSHQGMTRMFLLSKLGTTSSQRVTSFTRDWYVSFAWLNISFWMVVRRAGIVDPMSARGMGFLTPLSRRTERVCCLSKSLGPISSRSGTPYNPERPS